METNHAPLFSVLGDGPVARELAAAYRRLGCVQQPLPTPDQHGMHPGGMVVVGEGGVDKQELNAFEPHLTPSAQACRIAFDRAQLRRTASEELGLPTLNYEYAATPAELEAALEHVGYPCVVKSGGEQVTLHAAPREALPLPAMVERYIEFDFEVTILAARSVDPATGQLATWFCEPVGTRHAKGRLIEAWQPAPLSEMAMGNARSIAARIVNALGCCGLFAIELFVDGEEVYFSQAHPVPRLDGMITLATQRCDQFELFARASMQLPIDATLTSPGASRLVYNSAFSPARLAAALAVEETTVRFLDAPVNAALVLSTADTVGEARERCQRAAEAFL